MNTRAHFRVMESESQIHEWVFEDDLYRERVRQQQIQLYNQLNANVVQDKRQQRPAPHNS